MKNNIMIVALALVLSMTSYGFNQRSHAGKRKKIDISKYLDQMQENPDLRFAFGAYDLKEYAFYDLDGDGKDEVFVSDSTVHYKAIYAIVGDTAQLIAYADGCTNLVFYKNAVQYSAYYSPGRSVEGAQVVKDSKPTDYCLSEVEWNIFSDEQEVTYEWCIVNDKTATAEDFHKFIKQLGEPVSEPTLHWQPIN